MTIIRKVTEFCADWAFVVLFGLIGVVLLLLAAMTVMMAAAKTSAIVAVGVGTVEAVAFFFAGCFIREVSRS